MTIDYSEEEYEAAEEIYTVLVDFGLSGSITPPPSRRDLSDPIEKIIASAHSIDRDITEEAPDSTNKHSIVRDQLWHSPYGTREDHKYTEGALISGINTALNEIGFGLDFEIPFDEFENTISTNSHPRAYFLYFEDTGGNESTLPFRYPPTRGTAARNHEALLTAINHEFLIPRGYRFMLIKPGGDNFSYFLIENDRFDEVRQKYGDELVVFGYALREDMDLVDQAKQRSDGESEAIDHEDAYGVPEPDGTFKLEDVTK